jgi:hypothetical protein
MSLFSFLIAPVNLFFLILLSEIIWVILFNLASLVGSIVDEVTCFSLSFFILGFASIELCFGLLLLIFLKQIKLTLNLSNNLKNSSIKTFEKLLLQKRPKLRI